MACGWHRGYFGMHSIAPTSAAYLSVWDSGQEAIDRDKCPLTTASRWWARAKGWLQAISATRELAAIAIGFTVEDRRAPAVHRHSKAGRPGHTRSTADTTSIRKTGMKLISSCGR